MNTNAPAIEDVGPLGLWPDGKCEIHGHLSQSGREKYLPPDWKESLLKKPLRIFPEWILNSRLELGDMVNGEFVPFVRPDNNKILTCGIVMNLELDRDHDWIELWPTIWGWLFPNDPYPEQGKTGAISRGCKTIWARSQATGAIGQIVLTAPRTHVHINPRFLGDKPCPEYCQVPYPSGKIVTLPAKATPTLGDDGNIESGLNYVHMGPEEYEGEVASHLNKSPTANPWDAWMDLLKASANLWTPLIEQQKVVARFGLASMGLL